MNNLVILAILSTLTTLALAIPSSPPRLPRQWISVKKQVEQVNFETYLKENPREVQSLLKCLFYNGHCDTIGKTLKDHIFNGFSTACKNCNEKNKKVAGIVIRFFQTNYPKEWNDGVQNYRNKSSKEGMTRLEAELGMNLLADIPLGQSTAV